MAHEIVIPRLGWSMDEGTFVGWVKGDGDIVRLGDPLFRKLKQLTKECCEFRRSRRRLAPLYGSAK